jgi:hypothetical protein
MSRTLTAVAVDIDKLRKVPGSNDKRLLARVLAGQAEDIAFHDEFFGKSKHHYLPIGQAIEQLIRGQMDGNATPLFQYEHALAMIAEVLGEVLDNDAFTDCHSDYWREINSAVRQVRKSAKLSALVAPTPDEALRRGSCVPIPLDRRNPLGTGHLEKAACAASAAALSTLDLTRLIDSGKLEYVEETEAALIQYTEWLKAASKSRRGLYLHL